MIEKPTRETIRTRKKWTAVAQQIVNEIVDSGMQTGDRLQGEAEMSAEFGVSRATIREALQALESQGALSRKTGPSGGPIVAPPSADYLAANIALRLQLDGGTFRDVVSARLKLEPLIASSVAEYGCPNTIRKLQEIVQEAHNSSRTKKLSNATGEFHDVLAAGAGNPLFAYLMLALHYIAKPYIRRVPNLDLFQQRLGRYHPQIVDAIAAGASDAAADLMRRDILEFIDYVEQEMPQLFDEKIKWSQVHK